MKNYTHFFDVLKDKGAANPDVVEKGEGVEQPVAAQGESDHQTKKIGGFKQGAANVL